MKKLLLVLLLLTFTVAAKNPSMPMQAQFCGNKIVPVWKIKQLRSEMLREGCNQADMRFIQVEKDHYLGYAVKIVLAY